MSSEREQKQSLSNPKLKEFQSLLDSAGFNEITTEIKKNIDFYFAETYHQQYLYKNPNGYCGLGGCGVKFK